MTQPADPPWIEPRLVAARPRAVAALLRYFRDLDTAEEAFQEACLRALRTWPKNGPPRDAEAWLIMVGRNAGLDQVRRRTRLTELPDEAEMSDREDVEPEIAERLDAADYRDDILRLLFICCHPDLPATQQIALALRIVSGLPVSQIARAFLVGERAMEQRITRAKARVAKAEVPFETPGPAERADRVAAVAAMIYLVFNAGYTDCNATDERAALSGEAIRLGRLLLRMFPAEPEIMGLLALMLLQHSRQAARVGADGLPILLDDQDRSLWNRLAIHEALALLDKALRHRRPGPYQVQSAIAATHARAVRPEDTDWSEIDQLYAALEHLAPSPVVTLNRAVAVSKLRGPEAALEMIEPLARPLDGYFYFHGLRGVLLDQLGRSTEAIDAFGQAIALAGTAAEAAHIRQHLDRLAAASGAHSMVSEKKSEPLSENGIARTSYGQNAMQTEDQPMTAPDPKHVLTLDRTLDAPAAKLWRCWTEPVLLKQWFCPKPWYVSDATIDLTPGGAFFTVMNGPDGERFENAGVVLEFEPQRRLVTTDAFLPGWVPTGKAFMTAHVTFEDVGGDRARYVARAMHWNEETLKQHEAMGFHEGWGKAADQLEALARSI